MDELINIVVKEAASDLHLSSDNHPTIRVNGVLIPLLKRRELTKEDTLGFIRELLTPEQEKHSYQQKKLIFHILTMKNPDLEETDFPARRGRSRFKTYPKNIKSLEELNLPPILETFAQKQQGFFLSLAQSDKGRQQLWHL